MKLIIIAAISLLFSYNAFADNSNEITIEDFIVKYKEEASYYVNRPRFFLYKAFSVKEHASSIGQPVQAVTINANDNKYHAELTKYYYNDLEIHCLDYYGYKEIFFISILTDNFLTYRGVTAGDTVKDILDKYGDATKISEQPPPEAVASAGRPL